MPTDGKSAAGPMVPSGDVAHVFGSDPAGTPAALPPFLSFLAAIIARRPPERPRARHCGPAPAWTAP